MASVYPIQGSGAWTTRLAPSPDAPAEARWFLWTSLAREGLLSEELETAVLLLSELVSNAYRHADPRGPIDVTISLESPEIRVSVLDPGPPFDPSLAVQEARPGGLRIVDRLAARWGGEPTEAGMEVWFEVDAEPD